MGGSPYQTPATTINVGRNPDSFSTANLIGHQMYFWNQIAFLAACALGLIFLIMILCNEFSPTLLEVAFYIFGAACLVSSVSLGFLISIPRNTRCAPIVITAFGLTVAGTAILWIFHLGDIISIVLPIIGIALFYAGYAVLFGGLQTLCKARQRNDALGNATAGMIISILTVVVIIYVVIAVKNGWVPSSRTGAKVVVSIYYLLSFGLIAATSAMTMTTFGRLKSTFQNR